MVLKTVLGGFILIYATMHFFILPTAISYETKERGESSWWVVAVIIFGVYGAVIYLMEREDDGLVRRYRCSDCLSVYYKESLVKHHEEQTDHDVIIDRKSTKSSSQPTAKDEANVESPEPVEV